MKRSQADCVFEPLLSGLREVGAEVLTPIEERLCIDGEPFASRLMCRPMATSGIIRNDAGRERGRFVRPANRFAPQVGALNHACRRDWEADVSGQGKCSLFVLLPRKRRGLRLHGLLHLQTQQQRLRGRLVDLGDEGGGGHREGVADDASQPLVVLILEGGARASISLKSAGMNLVWRLRARLPLIGASE